MDGKRARSLMRGVAALALAMSLGARWIYILILQLSIHPPSFGSLFLPAPGACTSLSIIGAESIHILAVLAPSWVRAGWRSDDRCDHPPNRRAERAFALAASSSRSLGGAAVSSEASKRSEIFAMSSTAE